MSLIRVTTDPNETSQALKRGHDRRRRFNQQTVDHAVTTAAKAYPAWRSAPPVKPAQVMDISIKAIATSARRHHRYTKRKTVTQKWPESDGSNSLNDSFPSD